MGNCASLTNIKVEDPKIMAKGMVIIHDEKMNKDYDEKLPEPKLKNPKRRNPF